MRIALLAASTSIHTIRWTNALAYRGHEVHLMTCHPGIPDNFSQGVAVHTLPFPAPAGYFLDAIALKTLLRKVRPDVLNAHFASGYGTMGRLSAFHPYVLSVWGSDVYDFPCKSSIHRSLLRKNLLAADAVCSTSNVMAKQVRKICPEISDIDITPFGVDTDLFSPDPESRDPRYITIGTVKTLDSKYGIDTLLEAFANVKRYFNHRDEATSKRLRLMIVGSGPQEYELKRLAGILGIADQCHWTGKAAHRDVPKYLNQFDVFSALSRLDSESFGVAVIEASACGLPVVVSDAGGLPEVVRGGRTGLVVPREDPEAACRALVELIRNESLRKKMGETGREHVRKEYEWGHCVDILEGVLKKTLR